MKSLKLAVLSIIAAVPLAAQAPVSPPAPAAPAAPATAPARQRLPNDSLELARKYAGWIWTNQIDSLFAHDMGDDAPPNARADFTDQLAQIAVRAGEEQLVMEERWVRRNGNRQYWRIARFSTFTEEPMVLRLVIRPDGRIGGSGFGPLSRVPPIDPEP